jgi:hypothetical protein
VVHVRRRRTLVWALAAVLLLGASAPVPRADVRALAPSDGLVATADVSVDVDQASALLDRSTASVRVKAPTRSAHAAPPGRRVDGRPTCAPLERATSLVPPAASVPLYALHRVYRI